MKNRLKKSRFVSGFTLIELLAVIVILGVVIAIAVPAVSNVIRDSREKAYIKTAANIERAAQLYVSNEVSALKHLRDHGDFIELTLQELVNNNYLNAKIVNPITREDFRLDGNVVKVTNNNGSFDYEFKPTHIRTGLVADYRFDDFQEPTVNLLHESIDTTFQSGSTTGWFPSGTVTYQITSEMLFEGAPVMKIFPSATAASGILATSITRVPANTVVTMSMWIFIPSTVTLGSTWEVHRHALPNGECLSGTCHHYTNIETSNLTWNNSTEKNRWIRRTVTIRTSGDTTVSGYNVRIFCYSLGPNPAGTFIYMSQPQIEIKPYATAFTPNTRTGIINDHSINNNDVTLTLANTPRWIGQGRVGAGAYEFNKNTVVTPFRLEGLNSYTVSAWIYEPSTTTVTRRGINLGVEGTGRMWILFGNRVITLNTWFGTDGGDFWHSANYAYNFNEWVKLTAVFNRTAGLQILYINGNFHSQRSINTTHNWSNNNFVIGGIHETSNYEKFIGYIDDVYIYNRALTATEIKHNYDAANIN